MVKKLSIFVVAALTVKLVNALPFFEPKIFKESYTVPVYLARDSAKKLESDYQAGLNKYKKQLQAEEVDSTSKQLKVLLNKKIQEKNMLTKSTTYIGGRPASETERGKSYITYLDQEIKELQKLIDADTTLNKAVERGVIEERNVLLWERFVELPELSQKEIEEIAQRRAVIPEKIVEPQKLVPDVNAVAQDIKEKNLSFEGQAKGESPERPAKIKGKADWSKTDIYKELQSDLRNINNPSSQFSLFRQQLEALDNLLYDEQGKTRKGVDAKLFPIRSRGYEILGEVLRALYLLYDTNKNYDSRDVINTKHMAIVERWATPRGKAEQPEEKQPPKSSEISLTEPPIIYVPTVIQEKSLIESTD